MPKPIIIDCDPGHDDAIAMLLAFAKPELVKVLAVTIVAGNQTLEKTVLNALKVLSFAGIQCEVAAGYDRPLIRELEIAPEVHGETGLDGPELPDPTFAASPKHAVQTIIDHVRASSEKVTLVATGPLTNVAAALIGAPDIKQNLERIVLMGGAARLGNWTPAAEFNILVDPEASSAVFQSGVPVTMVGLDVTHEAQVMWPEVEMLLNSGRKVGVMVGELLDFFGKFHATMGFEGMPLHDPLAMAVVLDPTIVETQHLPVRIETQGRYTTGRTVVDFYGVTGDPPNVDVALKVDRDRFVNMVMDAVLSYP
ncbi:MAG TPA: nucleoside hydrolase [Firmicutes bacterium]|jgi:pyrimidine-specific ribonucleoside hydrolase|nr:nucleoside hydrolase [Bacillota bacterium]HHT42171.1 nucleoside hydrolase [Bacillota bacterium]